MKTSNRANTQQACIKTLTGHSFMIEHGDDTTLEDFARGISRHCFPKFKPSDDNYSNNITVIFCAKLVNTSNFADMRLTFRDEGCVHAVVTRGSELDKYLHSDEVSLDNFQDTSQFKQPEKPVVGTPIDVLSDATLLLPLNETLVKQAHAQGLEKHLSLLQGMTVFAWLSFGGLASGGSAWLSVASNIAMVTGLNTGAIIGVAAVAVFAVASLVFGVLGAKACHKSNLEVRQMNNLFENNKEFSVGDDNSIPLAQVAATE